MNDDIEKTRVELSVNADELRETRTELRQLVKTLTAERKPNAIGLTRERIDDSVARLTELELNPRVLVVKSDEHEVDLMFHGASADYVMTQERDDIGDWLHTLRHISRKSWFTPAHATAFATVMNREMRLP